MRLLWPILISSITAFNVDKASCDPISLQQDRPAAGELLEGETKFLVDPKDFDTLVTVRLRATDNSVGLIVPGFPPFDIRYDQVELPLFTYYDRCFELATVSHEQLILCFDCSAHRTFWMASIMERVFSTLFEARGSLPIWPQPMSLPTVTDRSVTDLHPGEAVAMGESEAAQQAAASGGGGLVPPEEPEETQDIDQNIYVHVLLAKGADTPDITLGALDLSQYLKTAVDGGLSSTTSTSTTTTSPPLSPDDAYLSPLELAERAVQRRVEASVELLDAMNNRRASAAESADAPELDTDVELALEAAAALDD